MKPFKRKAVKDESYFKKLIHYIHHNPVEAGMVEKPQDWKFSSYPQIVSRSKSFISKERVISHFDNLQNFIYCHQNPPTLSGINL